MAKKGRAGAALCIAAVGSWIAGTFGVLMLTVVAPPLATIALKFGPPEYTALLVLGLIFLAYMSSSSLVRTLLMACIGLLLGMIGIDNMTGHFRYSFDLAELGDGIGIVPVAVGLFGLGEILSTPSHKVVGEVISPKLRELLPNRQEWRESIWPIGRGSLLGFHHRHHPGLRAYHLQLPVLRAGAARLQTSGGIRQGRGRRRRRAGIGQQCGLDRRLRADAGARHSDRADHRGADGRADGARRFDPGRSSSPSIRMCSGASSPRCMSAT